MQISYFPDQISLAGRPIMEKFIETVRKTDAIKLNDMNCDAVVIWSVLWQGRMIKNQQVYNHYRDAGKPVIILETGNLIRGETFKVCINNINGLGQHAIPDELDLTRISKFTGVTSPIVRGDNIMICTQQDKSLLWKGQIPALHWVEKTLDTVRRFSRKPVIVRVHPKHRGMDLHYLTRKYKNVILQTPEVNNDIADFTKSLKSVWCVVNHNSGCAVEAAMHSIPVFCDGSSLAGKLSNLNLKDIDLAVCKTTQSWMDFIVHTEWFVDEIEQGIPWKILRNKLT